MISVFFLMGCQGIESVNELKDESNTGTQVTSTNTEISDTITQESLENSDDSEEELPPQEGEEALVEEIEGLETYAIDTKNLISISYEDLIAKFKDQHPEMFLNSFTWERNPNEIYLTANAIAEDKMRNAVYSYDGETYTEIVSFEDERFKPTIAEKQLEFFGGPEYNIIGYQELNGELYSLILFIKDGDSSPGPCFRPALATEDSMRNREMIASLKMENFELTKFQFKPEDLTDIQKEAEECIEEITSNITLE